MRYLTDKNLKTGGNFKVKPKDFIVEEVPLYPLSGEGEHTFLLIEKHGISTFEAIKRICRQIKFKDRNVGLAGLKDAQAITRQYLSFQLVPEEKFRDLEIRDVKIIGINRHNNKLRKGQLRSNKFICVLRDVAPDAEETAHKIASEIAEKGLPNYYDTQRFGMFDNNHILGMHLIKQDYKSFVDEFMKSLEESAPEVYSAYLAEDYEKAWELTPDNRKEHLKMLNKLRQNKDFEYAVKMLDKKTLRLHVSALQSYLFNEMLDARIDAGTLNTVNNGDVAYLHRNGAAFIVEEEETDKKRCETFEISPSGPVVGTKLLLAEDTTGAAEREILEKYELTLEDFKIGDSLSQPGARRAFRVQPENLSIRKEENNLAVDFSLPSGSYATIFLKELTKPNC